MYNVYTLVKRNTLKGNKMTVTKQERLLEALQAGEQLTAKQIAARFSIANPTATVSTLQIFSISLRLKPSTGMMN